MHQVEYEEGKELAQNNTCGSEVDGAPCGAELLLCWGGTWGLDSYVLRCAKNEGHQGMIARTSMTQDHRRGSPAPFPLSLAVERRMMPKEDLQRAMNMIAVRYPKAIDDAPTAALFLLDCLRLDIDPLLSPAEAVPITFTNNRTGKKTVTMIITEDGWLSMAARGCPDRWAGAPRAEPVKDPDLAESLCGDPNAWLWKASGRTRGMPPDSSEPMAYGWFTKADHKKAKDNHTPAGTQPGNQARIRAIKRWVRENFPDCRQRMLDYTRDLLARSPETDAVQEFVDAEYSIIVRTEIDQNRKKESEAERKLGGPGAPKHQTPESSKEKKAGKTNLHEAETGQEKNGVATATLIKTEPAAGQAIDFLWLETALQEINWPPTTAISYLVSKYKIHADGSLIDVISRLKPNQVKGFVDEIKNRQTSIQHNLL